MRSLIKSAIHKVAYPLTVACYDIGFGVVFIILALKLFLFDYEIGLDRRLGMLSPCYFSDLGMVLIFLSFVLIIRNDLLKFFYLYLVDTLCSLLFVSNSLFRTYFRDFVSASDIYGASQLTSVSDTIVKIMHHEYLYLVDLVFLPFFFLVLKKGRRTDFGSSARVTALCLFVSLGVWFNHSLFFNLPEVVHQEASTIEDRSVPVMYFGIINYQILDGYTFAVTALKRNEVTKADRDTAYAWLRTREGEKLSPNDLTGSGKGRNLIIIQAESMQNFLIGMKYMGREVTPHLNKLAAGSIYFDNIYDQTWDGNSSDATLLANSSLYPARVGAAAFLYGDNSFDSLPKVLEGHGYETATMHANVGSYWNSAVFEKALGFEHQYYKRAFSPGEIIGWGLSDRAFFSQCTGKIARLPRPFYAFLRTLTTHSPFAYVTKDIDPFPLGDLEGTLTGGYLRSMHYLDAQIGAFLHELDEAAVLSRTIIVIYGDHRARLSQDDLRRAGVTDMREENKIPLIISIPGRKQPERRHVIGGLVDVTPTLCNILGIDVSHEFFLGKDLEGSGEGYAIFRNGSFISPDGAIDEAGVREDLRLDDLILEKNVLGAMKGGKRG
jgi:lipoteichoic acid synthase